jgi:hypothetical protein
MSIDSVDIRTLTTALLSVPKRARIQAGLPKSGFFFALDAVDPATGSQNRNPELGNVINTAQTVTHELV